MRREFGPRPRIVRTRLIASVREAAAGESDGEALQLQAGIGERFRELGLRRRRARSARRRCAR